MLEKMTENMKFFVMLLVYVVYLTWWASDLTTSLAYQREISDKTVELLDAHIKECTRKEIRLISIESDLRYIKRELSNLEAK